MLNLVSFSVHLRVTKNKKAKEKVMKEFHTLNKTLSVSFTVVGIGIVYCNNEPKLH